MMMSTSLFHRPNGLHKSASPTDDDVDVGPQCFYLQLFLYMCVCVYSHDLIIILLFHTRCRPPRHRVLKLHLIPLLRHIKQSLFF
ncbi:hypothetical protein Hanom_Chr10g00959751 [Helianthus anomalus]